MLDLTIISRGRQQAISTLNGMRPDRQPRIRSEGLEAAAKGVQRRIRTAYLRGPRPMHLDRIHGDTIDSIQIDRRQLPDAIQIGSAMLHLELAEFGRSGRRRRPAFQPALEDELAERMPDAFIDAWQKFLRKGISGGSLLEHRSAGARTI